MLHYDDSALRRSLDEPGSVDPALHAHVASCESCRARRGSLAQDAAFAARLLGEGVPGAIAPALSPVRERRARRLPRWFPGAAALAAAAAIVLAFAFTPLGGLASQWLTIFEPQQFVPIGYTSRDRQQAGLIPHLESFGTFERGPRVSSESVASTSGLDRALGFTPRTVGVVPPGKLRAFVHPIYSVAFTFSAAKARAYEARYHRALPPMPPGLDGTTVRVAAGPMLIRAYGGSFGTRGRGFDGSIVFFEAPAPRVTSTGASEATLASYLLSLPNVPPSVAAELRAIGDPAHSLPVPLPIDKVTAEQVPVDGVMGLAIGDETGLGSGVLWLKNGMAYAVAGSAKESEILGFAAGFK